MERESSLKLIESYFSQANLQRILTSRPALLENQKLQKRSISIDLSSARLVPKNNNNKVSSLNSNNSSFESFVHVPAIKPQHKPI